MGKQSKYTAKTVATFLDAIRRGRTVKDACSLVSISDMTLSRWRKRYPDFNADYIKAVSRQWRSLDAAKESGLRTYRRNADRLKKEAEKQAKIRKMAEEEQELARAGKPLTYKGLRIRYGNIADDEPLTPCINPSNGFVEYLKRLSGYSHGSAYVGGLGGNDCKGWTYGKSEVDKVDTNTLSDLIIVFCRPFNIYAKNYESPLEYNNFYE